MTILPIVERELRVASRQAVTYWSRFGAAAAALGLGGWILHVSRRSSPSEIGAVLFATLAAVLFIYIVLAGIHVSCDCVSEENREGTLGLLFLTDLKGYDIVFGKLSASSVRVFYGVIATVPILAIPILLGGVTYGEFWRVALTGTNLLFFFLSTGILASSFCRSGAKAVGLAALITAILSTATPLMVLLAEARGRSIFEPLLVVSPAYNCFVSFEDVYRLQRTGFWINTLLTHLYAWVFLALACWFVPRSWTQPQARKTTSLRLRFANFLKIRAVGNAQRRAVIAENPYFWRCRPSNGSRWALWLTLGTIALGVVIIGWHGGRSMNEPVLAIMPILLNMLVKGWAAFQATQSISEDRRSGGLELLLVTPFTEKELQKGQVRAFRAQFLPVIAVILLENALLVFLFLRFDRSSEIKIYYGVLCTTLVADMQALPWVGMWMALKARSANRAASATILRILVLPAAAAVILLGILGAANLVRNETTLFITWGLVSLVFSSWFFVTSRVQISKKFRELAASQGVAGQTANSR